MHVFGTCSNVCCQHDIASGRSDLHIITDPQLPVIVGPPAAQAAVAPQCASMPIASYQRGRSVTCRHEILG